MKAFDVVILGAGAAGLFCAITAGQRGRRVLVLERSNKAGKKILMSGGGRCNFTNLYTAPDRFLSANPDFCKSALSRYTQWDFIDLVKRHRIPFHEKTKGQLFCNETSRDILAMLLKECAQAGVRIEVGCEVTGIEAGDDFRLATSHGAFQAEALVVATGGLSVPNLGGSDYGYKVARQFGLRVLPCRAGLVPFTFTDAFRDLSSRLSGLSVHARVSTGTQAFTDAVLFTHRGLSGPAVLQLSMGVVVGIRRGTNGMTGFGSVVGSRAASSLEGPELIRPGYQPTRLARNGPVISRRPTRTIVSGPVVNSG